MHIDPAARCTMIADLHRGRTRGPWLRLLSEVLTLAGPKVDFLRHSEKPWASATFSGSRHTIALSFAGVDAIEAGERFISLLPDHEFSVPGQLVADAAVTSVDHTAAPDPELTLEVELLLLEEL